MLFNSIEFIIFFPIVVLLYYIIPRRFRCVWLLVASYYFYMSWNAKYAVLIIFSTAVTYLSGIMIGKVETATQKKAVVAVSFVSNLAVLGFFKYFDFLIDNLNFLLHGLNITVTNPFSFVLPVGISFYTFQALSYTMDVYRGDIEPERNFLKYALFVSFFPQLVAGPIERSGNLLKQVQKVTKEKMFTYDKFASGIVLMAWGMFQKMVIADRLAIFVDSVFGDTYRVGTFDGVLGVTAFAFQIYCDFGGYSNIAIGAARVMGFELMENFSAPYLSESISELWRRWHISLSGWFKDYLYIPLGGNRKGKLYKYRNIAITFVVSGLWHGANWTYVIWGALHAVYQIVGDITKIYRKNFEERINLNTNTFSYHFGRVIGTFGLHIFSLIFFKAVSVREALLYIKNIFSRWNPWVLFDESMFNYGLDRREVGIIMFAIALLVAADCLRKYKDKTLDAFVMEQNYTFRIIVIVFLILFTLVYGEYGITFNSAKFIYFDF